MKKIYVILFFVIILIIIFAFSYYNTSIFGNNIIIKNENKIVDYILNIKEYEAEVEVTINSNKTTNTYKMRQIVSNELSSLEVISEGKINGLKIELANKTLKVQNTSLKLDKIYENYEPLLNNTMFLNTFIERFKTSNSTTYMEDEDFVFDVPKYGMLYVDIKSLKPKKLEIKDNTQNTNICIKYNSIEIK